MEVLSHPPSGLPWRSDFERLRLTQPLPPSPPLARIRNLSTIPRACTEAHDTMRTSGQNQRRQTENSGIKNRRRKGGDLQGRRLSLAPIRRRPVVASQPAARLGWRGLRHRSQLREPAEESLLPPPHVRRSVRPY